MKTNKFESLIEDIVKNYFVSLKRLYQTRFSDGEIDKASPFYIYFIDVERAFKRLDKEQRKIINNEYFYQEYSYWWKKEYKERTFLKLRKEAVKHFVEVFYEIH